MAHLKNLANPELREGEFFLGNYTKKDWELVGWKTKRRGNAAFTAASEPYLFQDEHKIAPGFARIAEHPQHAKEIQDSFRRQ